MIVSLVIDQNTRPPTPFGKFMKGLESYLFQNVLFKSFLLVCFNDCLQRVKEKMYEECYVLLSCISKYYICFIPKYSKFFGRFWLEHPVFVKMGQRIKLHFFLECIMTSVATKSVCLRDLPLFFQMLTICTVYCVF